MSEMVERVALAIAETVAGPGAQPKGNWLVAARAAIAAMREPTSRMGIVGQNRVNACTDYDGPDSDAAVRTWEAMIDAALER
jgi:hypothetical protein